MQVTCPNCGARYAVDPLAIGPVGRIVQCARCANRWLQTVAAAADNDPQTKLAQTCEANFYGGELALVKKNRKEAQRQLKLAADACPRSFVESTAAVAELILIR